MQQNSKTHLPKATISEAVEDLLLVPETDEGYDTQPQDNSRLSVQQLNTTHLTKTGVAMKNVSVIKGVPVAVVEFDDLYSSLWKQLRTL